MQPFSDTILLAEDDPDDRECYADSFASVSSACRVDMVSTAAGLLAYLNTHRADLPSLIVIDNRLPDGEAGLLLEQLKAGNRYPPIPVVVVTGACPSHLVEKLKSSGAAHCFSKPVNTQGWQQLAVQLCSLARQAGKQEQV